MKLWTIYPFKNFQYLIENEKPSYKEPPKEVCFYAYKKINHFKLKGFQVDWFASVIFKKSLIKKNKKTKYIKIK